MTLKFAILGLLAENPMSGFDLVGQFDVGLSVIWPAPQNEIYKILRALESEGAIRVADTGPRGRIVYAITPEGRTALTAWLREPADYTMRYEPMLKAVFMRQATPATRRAIAKADGAFAAEQLAKLRQADAKRRAERKPDPRADARRLIILFYEAMEKWAKEVADDK
ncbi:MAG: PadR family transcriptional regulator [Alphaproteobacteria bacterium]|nr:PadR family transcriptional regulator [Alphaproteobacteria bacterium]